MILTVYVPAHFTILRSTILAGSALVGSEHDSDRVLVDFEGNRYNASNLRTFEERLLHAAGRHVTHYPTVARMAVKRAELIEVGTYDSDQHTLTVTDAVELEAWQTIPSPSPRSRS